MKQLSVCVLLLIQRGHASSPNADFTTNSTQAVTFN